MLGGHNNGRGAHRLAVHIPQRHLAFRVRQQPGHGFVMVAAQLRNAAQHQMRVVQRRRHQVRRFPAGIAEHDTLIAGTLILVAGLVHALGNIGGLGMQMAGNVGMAPGEAFLVIPDIANCHPRQVDQQFRRHGFWPPRFSGQDHAIGGDQGFAGHAGIRIGRKIRIQYRIADAVRDFVGVAFRNGFGSEQVFAGIAHLFSRVRNCS